MNIYDFITSRPKTALGTTSSFYDMFDIEGMFRKVTDRAKHLKNVSKQRKNNVAELQDALYNIGAFADSLDNNDEASYYKAVDGLRGPMTNRAIQNAKNMGFDVDVNKGTIKQEAPRNLQAVLNHKRKYGVDDRSWYFDKKTNTGYRIENGNIVDKFEILTGLNTTSDGYTVLSDPNNPSHPYNPATNLMSTGAGIYTLGPATDGYGEKKFHLIEAERGNPRSINNRYTNMAFHAPAGPNRRSRFANNNASDNYVSYGCISPQQGYIANLLAKGNINTGDSVYVEPIVDGNYIYEDANGNIKTYYANMPTRLRGRNFNTIYDLNNILYNTGY